MGPYCIFCNTRCFLERRLKDGRTVLLATCAAGMRRDRRKVGEDHTTAINPVTGEPGGDRRDQLSPRFPQGTPGYEAYAAALRVELAKFAAGEPPYPYPEGRRGPR